MTTHHDDAEDEGSLDAPDTGMAPETWTVTGVQIGQRLDQFLAAIIPDVTRSEVQRWIGLPPDADAGVRLNGMPTKANVRLRDGDRLTVVRPAAVPTRVEPEAIPLDIVYEDADLLVIDKARGMVVHPAPGTRNGTLVNAVLAHAQDLSGIGGELRPGIVHRLDKDTGGLIVVAKNDSAHRSLQAQIQAKTADRRYLALVWGVPRFTEASVDAPIGRHPIDRKRMAVLPASDGTARVARTDLSVRSTYVGAFTLLEARLHTGRTHQIRVHCAYIQHPVVGDPIYGGSRRMPERCLSVGRQAGIEAAIEALNGQALHAFSLAFNHPKTGERLTFASPLPPPFQRLMAVLE